MSDILDLDALAPPDKQIKVRGKMLICKPLTIRNLISVVKLEDELKGIEKVDDILPLIKSRLSPFIPQIETDDTLDFTILEIRRIILFAQSISIPEPTGPVKEYVDPKKKVSSPEESLTSSVSTPDTQPKAS